MRVGRRSTAALSQCANCATHPRGRRPEREFVFGRRDRRARSCRGVRCAAWGGPSCSAAASSCVTSTSSTSCRAASACAPDPPLARRTMTSTEGGSGPTQRRLRRPPVTSTESGIPQSTTAAWTEMSAKVACRGALNPCTARHASEAVAAETRQTRHRTRLGRSNERVVPVSSDACLPSRSWRNLHYRFASAPRPWKSAASTPERPGPRRRRERCARSIGGVAGSCR